MAGLGTLVQIDLLHNFYDVVVNVRLDVFHERALAAVQALPSLKQAARIAMNALNTTQS